MQRFANAACAAALLTAVFGARRAYAHEEGRDEARAAGPEHREERLQEKLGLSAEQEAKLKDAMQAHRKAERGLFRRVRDASEKLSDQIADRTADQEIQATLDQLTSARRAMQDESEKFHEALAAFLTPTQRAKMLLAAMRGKGMRGGMGGPRGRMGGPMGGMKPRRDQEPGNGGPEE